MKKQSDMRLLSEEEQEMVSGGSTKTYLAAVDLMNGKYGTGESCRKSVTDEGLDYWSVQHMANALSHDGRIRSQNGPADHQWDAPG